MIPGLEKKKITVLCGGFSEEKEVSLRSGQNVYEALIRLGYKAEVIDPAMTNILDISIEIAFNVLHGTFGEDGGVQSLLRRYNIPCTGSDAEASMLGMNKLLTKMIMAKEALPTAPYFVIYPDRPIPQEHPLSYPRIIKPIASGSSVGMAVCNNATDFERESDRLTKYHGACLVEPFIEGQEITVGVIDQNKKSIALPILELISKNKFYDYEAKYTPDMTTFILPARLSPELTAQCQGLAIQLHKKVGAKGMSRTDMIVDRKGHPIILEINTIPGMTDLSDLPAQAKEAGLTFDQLVEIILESAL